jgi:hypothetical protein
MLKTRLILLIFTTALLILIMSLSPSVVAQSLPAAASSDPNIFLATLVIICLASVLAIFLIVSGFVAFAALKYSPNAANLLNSFFTSNNAIQILTISAVLVTALFLALSDRLSAGVLSLLSSIAGYTLGGIRPDQSTLTQISKSDSEPKD